ncbi:uncharacterized protein LOC120123612 [Hibiscus syriacus]|uniref:uncharacterized protein LOC120123612 n=1 Tax=Hibiscus syriacus TaxID=106335 RepID=UPI001923D1E4|nr:uncharacterized protein LOC120123612 [Hibiscus syriacus]
MMRYGVSRRRRALVRWFLILCAAFTSITWLMLTLRSLDAPPITTTTAANGAMLDLPAQLELRELKRDASLSSAEAPVQARAKTCATVEEMGKGFKGRIVKETLRVGRVIQAHFSRNGAPRIRELPPERFCRHGFVIGKSIGRWFWERNVQAINRPCLECNAEPVADHWASQAYYWKPRPALGPSLTAGLGREAALLVHS